MKPMSQDSYSAGRRVPARADHGVCPSTTSTTSWSARSRTSVGSSAGSEVYLYGNPGEGHRRAGVSSRPATQPVRRAEAETAVRRAPGVAEPPVLGQLVPRWQLRPEPSLRQLRGPRELRRNPHPGFGSFAVDQQQGAQSFRPGGNANRAFDLDEMMWDSHGNLDPTGRLATDRPHVFKLYGAYLTSFGTQIGVNRTPAAARRSRPTSERSTRRRSSSKAAAIWAARRCWRPPTCCSRTSSGWVTATTFGWSSTCSTCSTRRRRGTVQSAEPQPLRRGHQPGQPGSEAARTDYQAMIDGNARRPERERQRTTDRHARPVERRHDRSLHGEVPVLASPP